MDAAWSGGEDGRGGGGGVSGSNAVTRGVSNKVIRPTGLGLSGETPVIGVKSRWRCRIGEPERSGTDHGGEEAGE
jgi:hypothetical protein